METTDNATAGDQQLGPHAGQASTASSATTKSSDHAPQAGQTFSSTW